MFLRLLVLLAYLRCVELRSSGLSSFSFDDGQFGLDIQPPSREEVLESLEGFEFIGENSTEYSTDAVFEARRGSGGNDLSSKSCKSTDLYLQDPDYLQKVAINVDTNYDDTCEATVRITPVLEAPSSNTYSVEFVLYDVDVEIIKKKVYVDSETDLPIEFDFTIEHDTTYYWFIVHKWEDCTGVSSVYSFHGECTGCGIDDILVENYHDQTSTVNAEDCINDSSTCNIRTAVVAASLYQLNICLGTEYYHQVDPTRPISFQEYQKVTVKPASLEIDKKRTKGAIVEPYVLPYCDTATEHEPGYEEYMNVQCITTDYYEEGQLQPAFLIEQEASITIIGTTFTGFVLAGSFLVDNAYLHTKFSRFLHNEDFQPFGLYSNQVSGHGGAIKGVLADITVEETEFLGNKASFGGAISMMGGEIKVYDSSLGGNAARCVGGALVASSASKVEICDTTFYGNSVGRVRKQYYYSSECPYGVAYGGAMAVTSFDDYLDRDTDKFYSSSIFSSLKNEVLVAVTIDDSEFLDNRAYFDEATMSAGGGIYLSSHPLGEDARTKLLTWTEVINEGSSHVPDLESSSEVYPTQVHLTIRSSLFKRNKAFGPGAAVYAFFIETFSVEGESGFFDNDGEILCDESELGDNHGDYETWQWWWWLNAVYSSIDQEKDCIPSAGIHLLKVGSVYFATNVGFEDNREYDLVLAAITTSCYISARSEGFYHIYASYESKFMYYDGMPRSCPTLNICNWPSSASTICSGCIC